MLGKVNWWVGEVEDKDDPEKRGRIKVRIHGIHTNEKVKDEQKGQGIPTEDLPWAICVMPLTFGGVPNRGTVPPPAVMPGAWVLGISTDGDAYQSLIVLGVLSIAMNPESLNPSEMSMNSVTGSNSSPISGKISGNMQFDTTKPCQENYEKVIEFIESSGSGNQNLVSPVGAAGVMQIMPGTAVDAFNDACKDPELRAKLEASTGIQLSNAMIREKCKTDANFNRLIGKGYYRQLCKRYGDPVIAAGAYNAGAGGMDRLLRKCGDPRTGEISYEEFANRAQEAQKNGNAETGIYIKRFIKFAGKENIDGCSGKGSEPAKSEEV